MFDSLILSIIYDDDDIRKSLESPSLVIATDSSLEVLVLPLMLGILQFGEGTCR